MGIKCYCPKGHKLNIKSYLAGRRAVCPHCGERFRIPKEVDSAAENADDNAADSSDAPSSTTARSRRADPDAPPTSTVPTKPALGPVGEVSHLERARSSDMNQWNSPPLLFVRGLMYLLVTVFTIVGLIHVMGVPFALWILLAPAAVYGKTILATLSYLLSGGLAGSAR